MINWLIADEKTPIEAIILIPVNNKNPIEANAIFNSFVLTNEISDIILINVDKPRNENRRNISISFMSPPYCFLNPFCHLFSFR